ncbi:LL-diaminopimelate aminotransferase [Armatimonas rosea]|uniref:Aminotransferase n=1 Tax=Armatimonas rosea TaxID=685828 RepID=A0A7W9STL3_ARMRO|nr:LL-diaminopimelate aminotransferase [Armatimonas rosea]MBB6052610.1 LL-diaminopimelate aminotransferase [Armatimonas rosea]
MPQRASRLDLIPPYLFGEIARLKAKARAEGKDLIDFGIGDPDQPTPQPIIDKLYEFAQDPETHRYDESDQGDPGLTVAACQWFGNRYGVTLDPKSEIVLLIGSKEGLAHLCWAYINPGDVALIPDPNYTVPKVQTLLAGGVPYLMPLTAENNFVPDLTAIPSETAKKAKLLFLNYPHNPTGATAPLSFFEEAVRFAKEYDLLICNDCAYAEVGYNGYRPPSILQAEGAKDVAIETHSLSKTFNMTGWRIGFAVGNADAIASLNKMKSNIDSKQFSAISRAAGWALLNADNSETLALYDTRRKLLIDGLNSLGWNLPYPKAGFFVWIPVPEGHDSMSFSKLLLEKAGVLVIPGVGYGENGDKYVRMSLTIAGDKAGERVTEAIGRIREALK